MFTVHSGSGARYPWFVAAAGRHEYLQNSAGKLRRFASSEAAQRAADKLNRARYGSAEMRSARLHLQASIRMLNRATRDAAPTDERIAIAQTLFDAWQQLGGLGGKFDE